MIDPGVWRTLFRIAALTVSASAFSCSGKERIPGQLVVSVETDVALPKAVDTVKLEVLHGGVVQFSNLFTVGPNADILIPGTLTIVAGEGGGETP